MFPFYVNVRQKKKQKTENKDVLCMQTGTPRVSNDKITTVMSGFIESK